MKYFVCVKRTKEQHDRQDLKKTKKQFINNMFINTLTSNVNYFFINNKYAQAIDGFLIYILTKFLDSLKNRQEFGTGRLFTQTISI